jgi:hypothetical protein
MVSEDDIFIALGRPEGIGAGFKTDGANIVHGVEAKGTFIGVSGLAVTPEVFDPGPPDARRGVFGAGDTNGVYGQTAERGPEIGPPAGVLGNSRQAFGVVGLSSQLGGVLGRSDKFAGVFGSSSQSVGVGGRSDRSYGVLGLSFAPIAPGTNLADAPAGVYGQSLAGSVGVLGVGLNSTAVAGVAVREALAGFFQGNVVVTGALSAQVKHAVVPFPDGSKRLLHCMESPEHWFEDFGSARLTRGRVTVKLDADFAKVVKLNEYRVFLTPEGDCEGLYVRSKSGTSFEVCELQGGTSNIAFSYRIVAKRKDIKAHRRFAKIETTVPMPTGKARAALGRQAARLPSSMRALIAATTFPMPTGKVRAGLGRAARGRAAPTR